MPYYHCSKCNERANSKCVHQRNVFPEDMNAAVLSHILKFQLKTIEMKVGSHISGPRVKDGILSRPIVCLEYTGFPEEVQAKGDGAMLEYALLAIKSVPEESLRHYACDHDWIMEAKECSLGCCKNPDYKKPVSVK